MTPIAWRTRPETAAGGPSARRAVGSALAGGSGGSSPQNETDEVVYTATGEASTALGIRALDLYALSRAEPVSLCDRPDARAPVPSTRELGLPSKTAVARHERSTPPRTTPSRTTPSGT